MWLYDYVYKEQNNWATRDESGWSCPAKLCEKAIIIEEILTKVHYELSIGRNRDWTFYDVKL